MPPADLVDMIADRCPELRHLRLEKASGVAFTPLVTLLEKCVHLMLLDVRGIGLLDYQFAELHRKRATLKFH
jgi:hypothetical protein